MRLRSSQIMVRALLSFWLLLFVPPCSMQASQAGNEEAQPAQKTFWDSLWESLVKMGPILPVFPAITGLIGGGLAGAGLTWYLSRRAKRRDTAMQLILDYLSRFSKHGQANRLLELDPPSWTLDEENVVREIGDWFDIVAMLCNTNDANKKLVERAGIVNHISRFYPKAVKADRIREAWESWSEIRALIENQGQSTSRP